MLIRFLFIQCGFECWWYCFCFYHDESIQANGLTVYVQLPIFWMLMVLMLMMKLMLIRSTSIASVSITTSCFKSVSSPDNDTNMVFFYISLLLLWVGFIRDISELFMVFSSVPTSPVSVDIPWSSTNSAISISKIPFDSSYTPLLLLCIDWGGICYCIQYFYYSFSNAIDDASNIIFPQSIGFFNDLVEYWCSYSYLYLVLGSLFLSVLVLGLVLLLQEQTFMVGTSDDVVPYTISISSDIDTILRHYCYTNIRWLSQ